MRRAWALAATLAIVGSSVFAAEPARAQAGDPNSAAPYGEAINDQRVFVHGLLDQLEVHFGSEISLRWEGEAWAGTDSNKLWLKSEGELTDGKVENGQQEVYYSKPISTYYDLQVGLRYDIDSQSGRGWAAAGVEGLAPLFFHVSAAAYASDRGHFAAKLGGSYDLLVTQTVILQPNAELNLYSKNDPARGIGSGFSDLDVGLRLRYEFSRKFAPYAGLIYEKKFGRTGRYAAASGEKKAALRFTVGVRTWF